MTTKKRTTKKALPKAQKGLSTENSMYNFDKIHTGPDSTDPGVLRAQADKKKADAMLLKYKKKAAGAAAGVSAIKKIKATKKK